MIAKNKTIQKLISFLLIFGILAPSVFLSFGIKQTEAVAGVPVADYAGNTFLSSTLGETITDVGFTIKNWAVYIGKQLLMMAAKQLLAKMTQATINWINSDFHGSPLFLENPSSFFNDIAKSELKTLVNMFGYDSVLYPFGKQFALNAINSYQRKLQDNTQYTLSKVLNDPGLLSNYRNNFNYGGWNGFLINTQYPQNNYLGFQMLATDELARRIQGTAQNAAQKVQSLLQQGMGFLSPQTCLSNESYNNGTNEFLKPSFQYNVPYPKPTGEGTNDFAPSAADQAALNKWSADKDAAQAQWAKTNTCPGGLVNTTPGSVAANQIMDALGSPLRSVELDAALGNSISAILDALINHFFNKGLNALSEAVSPQPSVDNWSYDGNTLNGNASTYTAEALDIPQNVSVKVGQTTSTVISGGTSSYSIQTQSSASKAVAIATIDVSGSAGNKLTVTGIAPGTTSIIVKDSSTPAQTVTVTITVNAIGALAIIPANISTDTSTSNQVIAAITNGTEPYFIQISPNEEVAIAILSGTNLIVTGTNPGSTYIEIKDSSPTPKTVRANITIIDPIPLTVSQQSVLTYAGQTTHITISGGKEPYTIAGLVDPKVATAEIEGNILTIIGKGPGETSAVFRDSSLYPKTLTVTVAILAPLGSCKVIALNNAGTNNLEIKDINEAQCKNNGGQWTQNTPSP